jgi:hypothetical protein
VQTTTCPNHVHHDSRFVRHLHGTSSGVPISFEKKLWLEGLVLFESIRSLIYCPGAKFALRCCGRSFGVPTSQISRLKQVGWMPVRLEKIMKMWDVPAFLTGRTRATARLQCDGSQQQQLLFWSALQSVLLSRHNFSSENVLVQNATQISSRFFHL